MILKASQRGGAKQLGMHLLKIEDNEHLSVHEIRGFFSDDVISALKEAQAVSAGTKCRQFLFHVSLNPPEREPVKTEVFEEALERIEAATGLAGQPRVVVFHEKERRRHCHAVYSRIDPETMTAVNLPFFKNKLRQISRSLYHDYDWQMPQGLVDSQARDPRNFSLVAWQQAKRLGRNARDLKGEVMDCWAISDSRAAFEHALGERGMVLARGDRRGHVIVTHEGEVLSVARYTNKRAKAVRAKLGDPHGLPSVGEVRRALARDMKAAFRRHAGEAKGLKSASLAWLEARRGAMTLAYRSERAALASAQEQRRQEEARVRARRLKSGLSGLWQRITGRRRALIEQNQKEALAASARDRAQSDTMILAHLAERRGLQDRIKRARAHYAEMFRTIRKDRDQFNVAAGERDDEIRPRRRRSIRHGPEPEL